MVRSINARMLGKRVSECDLLGACWLSVEYICAEPEVLVCF
jgi:hypothetical protein